jgi:hypothetical protein
MPCPKANTSSEAPCETCPIIRRAPFLVVVHRPGVKTWRQHYCYERHHRKTYRRPRQYPPRPPPPQQQHHLCTILLEDVFKVLHPSVESALHRHPVPFHGQAMARREMSCRSVNTQDNNNNYYYDDARGVLVRIVMRSSVPVNMVKLHCAPGLVETGYYSARTSYPPASICDDSHHHGRKVILLRDPSYRRKEQIGRKSIGTWLPWLPVAKV